MNNAKMWLVVKPTVGIPLFLTGVAVGSFAVHVAVLTNTGWVGDFLKGQELGTSEMAAATTLETDENVAKASYVMPDATGLQEVTVIMPDGTTARAILKPNEVLASAPLQVLD